MKKFPRSESNQIPLLIFFSSLFIFIGIAGTRLFFSDEGVIIDQFYNLVHGSLALKIAKISISKGVFIMAGDNLYGIFSYSLLILSLPVFYILRSIDIFGAHLFILHLWALSGGIVVYLIARNRNSKRAILGGLVSYLILIAFNWQFFEPIYFPMWGELLSIEFTNILISSFLVLTVYHLFKFFFSNRIAAFASFFVILATPISFYAITLKHHSLAVFLTLVTFYFFYKYYERKDNKFIYFAYIAAGLCVWTRILDGAALLASLLISDIVIFRRSIKYILSISMIILISLLPLFSFNYLILGNPFSIMERVPLVDKPVALSSAKEIIQFEENPFNDRQAELLNELGYVWNTDIGMDWRNILFDITVLRSVNTFGIFLVSPFLAAALAFAVYGIKRKIKLNVMDKFLGVYSAVFILIYINNMKQIVTDTPAVLEYRYLLILYIVLLYFSLRIDKVRQLIESKLKMIATVYGIVLLVILIYFAGGFPVPFLDVYYIVALVTSVLFIILLSIILLTGNKKPTAALLDNLLTLILALSFALASFFLIFYYWVVSITYISPSQNHTVVPILEIVLKWMYRVIL